MAGDWIKVRASLINAPKLIRMARVLNEDRYFNSWAVPYWDTEDAALLSEDALRAVALALLSVTWSVAREHGKYEGSDLILEGLAVADLDHFSGVRGVGKAMASVGWAVLLPNGRGVSLPNFKEYNSPAMTPAERMRASRERKSVTNGCATERNNSATRVDKIREDKNRGEKGTNTHALEPESFAAFWSAYPRKQSKQAAIRAYIKAIATVRKTRDATAEDAALWILNAAMIFADSPKGKGDYCPYPATWLNDGRYDDDQTAWQSDGKPKATNARQSHNARDKYSAPGAGKF